MADRGSGPDRTEHGAPPFLQAPETLGRSDRREPESVIGGVGRKVGNLAGGPVTSGRVER